MFSRWVDRIEHILGEKIGSCHPVSGGCIARSFTAVTPSGKSYFIKSGMGEDVFIKEANSLKELSKPEAIRTPQVFYADSGLLILEAIPTGRGGPDFFSLFGEQLAKLHRYTQPDFGFYEDNFIGNTPQNNQMVSGASWSEFYLEKRLMFQFRLAEKNGYTDDRLTKKFSRLTDKTVQILNHPAVPSLLHGDLWSGNYLCDRKYKPVLIDPAVYYGDRETDLAMTKLFGGFPAGFYQAYQQEYPLPEGWEYRQNIYKLYHILNHLNMFGRSYLSETEYLINYYL